MAGLPGETKGSVGEIGDVVDPRCSLPGGTKGFQLWADGIGQGTTAGTTPIQPSALPVTSRGI